MSTLAADGNLRTAENLIRVDRDFWDVCPEPLASRLHPSLLEYKGIADLCRPFALDGWIIDASNRAVAGTIEDSERETLYQYLLSDGATVSHKTLAAVRRSPVVRDQRANWVAPDDLVRLPPTEAAFLDAVVSMPAPELAKRANLLRRLRIRSKLSADDLIRFAPKIGDDVGVAKTFEQLLNRNQDLLTPKAVVSLRLIPFLRNRKGVLLTPEQLHLPTTINLACLDAENDIVAGDKIALYRKLGCWERPSFQTLRSVLKGLEASSLPPRRPDILYPALVRAMTIEKRPVTTCIREPILWVDGKYYNPEDTLVGSRIPRLFRAVFPIFQGADAIYRAYAELGASAHPREYHWVRFFLFFGKSRKIQSVAERNILHDAYRRRGDLGLPIDLDKTAICLLARNGELYSLQDLREERFLEDDYPQLAATITQTDSNIAFADILEGNRVFFAALGLRRLSEACGVPRNEIGPARSPPGWFRQAHLNGIVSLFQSEDFAIALRELA